MRVTQVTALIRKNLGNYEHEEYTAQVVAGTEENVTPGEMMDLAKKTVLGAFTRPRTTTTKKEEEF